MRKTLDFTGVAFITQAAVSDNISTSNSLYHIATNLGTLIPREFH
jgi:hypothetical protein